MSTDAKLLYGLMLDRMGLSVKNRWLDDENRVYIVYTLEDIISDLGCARQKTVKLLEELESSVGLIKRKRQGQGKPNIIYVMNFMLCRVGTNFSSCGKRILASLATEDFSLARSETLSNLYLVSDFNSSLWYNALVCGLRSTQDISIRQVLTKSLNCGILT